MNLPCAWCIHELKQEIKKESHGICEKHLKKLKEEYTGLKEKKQGE